LVGDEGNYLGLATNLTHGFFSPPGAIHLWWGPGFPLLLAPLVALHAPLLVLRLLNAALVVGALICIYATVRCFLPRLVAGLATAFLAVYVPAVQPLALVLSEPLAVLLASLAMYLWCRGPRGRGTLGTALALAWLALTKVLFGWVLLAGLELLSGLVEIAAEARSGEAKEAA
jgi:hypothetical protein